MEDRISIIVSTYKRKEKLKRLLESFSRLHCHCSLEFIIVDNLSDDGTGAIVEDWKRTVGFEDVKYHVLPVRSGVAHSRNVGISLSTGNILAFTDDDCMVDPFWVDRLYQRLTSCPDYAGVGGRVLPLGEDIYSTYYTVYRVLEPPAHINAVIGANCMFWKQPVVDAGLFDEYFIAPGGEEIALCMKLWLKGYRFGFEEQGIVYHDYRQSLKNFITTFYHYGHGERIIYEHQLNGYLQYMQYPEQIYDNLAFKNLFLFQLIFFLRMVYGIIRQRSFLGSMSISNKKKVMLIGLFALAHFSYHLGRGTFSGMIVKKVKKYLADRPDCLLTVDPDAHNYSPVLEITNDTIPPVLKPGRNLKSSITIKNLSRDRWISAEFLVTLGNDDGHTIFYQTPKPQNMIFFPGTEMVYNFSIKAPLKEQEYRIQLFLATPHGAPLSGKREKSITVSSELLIPDAKTVEVKFR